MNKESRPVKLIFAPKQKRDKKKPVFIRTHAKWIYLQNQSPLKTIAFTLRKFKYAANEEEAQNNSTKYHIYRVREDPKTRYRYVTEILN